MASWIQPSLDALLSIFLFLPSFGSIKYLEILSWRGWILGQICWSRTESQQGAITGSKKLPWCSAAFEISLCWAEVPCQVWTWRICMPLLPKPPWGRSGCVLPQLCKRTWELFPPSELLSQAAEHTPQQTCFTSTEDLRGITNKEDWLPATNCTEFKRQHLTDYPCYVFSYSKELGKNKTFESLRPVPTQSTSQNPSWSCFLPSLTVCPHTHLDKWMF